MSNFLKTKEEIKEWLESMGISKYTINDDLTVDVNESVRLAHNNLIEIPVQFGTVDGYFNCMRNDLISLKGSPRIVYGDFNCCYNNLKSLDGSPEKIFGDYICSMNPIQNLENFNTKISGNFINFVFNVEKGILELQQLYKPELKDYLSVRLHGKVLTSILDKKILANDLLIELPLNSNQPKQRVKL